MSAVQDELRTRLARVLPELEEPDWNDVVGRSGLLRAPVPRQRRRRFAPRVLAFAILVVLAGGSLALAFGGNVLDAFRSSPAPAPIKRQFRQIVTPPLPQDGAPPHSAMDQGKIVPASQQKVLGVPTSIGTVATLYVARTTNGSTCIDLVGKPIGFKGCNRTYPGAFPIRFAEHQWSGGGPAVEWKREFVLVGRVASPGVRTVRLVYADGTHADIRLTDRWYGYEVPEPEAMQRLAPLRLEARTAAGQIVGVLPHPLGRLNTPPKFHPAEPKVSHVVLLARATLPNDGGTVTIASGRDTTGRLCFRHLRDGKSQTNIWDCSAAVGAFGYSVTDGKHVPISWAMGLRNDPHRPTGYGYAYAWGWVPPGITRLTVRFQGGGSQQIPLHQRFYLYVVPPSHWAAGTRPSILDARNAAGTIVSSRFLYPRQHCIYPGRDPLCRNIGYGTG